MPDDKDFSSPYCLLHDARLNEFEKNLTRVNDRILEFEKKIDAGFEQLHNAHKSMLDVVMSFRSKILGNGSDGIIQIQDRRIMELELRERFDARVDEEVAKKLASSGLPDYGSQEIPFSAIKTSMRETPLWGWVLLLMVLGPKGVEILISLVKQLQSLWSG